MSRKAFYKEQIQNLEELVEHFRAEIHKEDLREAVKQHAAVPPAAVPDPVTAAVDTVASQEEARRRRDLIDAALQENAEHAKSNPENMHFEMGDLSDAIEKKFSDIMNSQPK